MSTLVTINDRAVPVAPRETLLQAALKEGVAFPNSCRVGGCGACKCKLTRGSVRELTESGYLLSREELDGGYILACQSTPLGPVAVEVDLPETVAGAVVSQAHLTHDIVELTVQLDGPLGYRPGQYALLTLEGLDGVTRSYSFAAPPAEDHTARFIIRHVPGGAFSGAAHGDDLVGRGVTVTGPMGDFWLRDDRQPALFVAGGSGLAPILAMLRAAADAGDRRPVTLLFGARQQRDLYALAEIQAIADAWRGRFTFVPVLSEAADDASWQGARGLVTEHIGAHLTADTRAYLCGSPGMVDAAQAALHAGGVRSEDMHFDRFTTAADTAPEARPAARWWDYAKFGAFHAVGLAAFAALVLGGPWLTGGFFGIVALYLLADAYGGNDTSTHHYARPQLLTGLLWSALPLVSLLAFTGVWTVASGDPLGFGAAVQALTGYDALAARDAAHWGHHVAGLGMLGLMIGLVGTIPGHELTHRTWDRTSMGVGRWLLGFSFDANFAIEHVYGHHRYVSTTEDPATAPRGRNVYAHVLISTVRGNVSAWRIEVDRLRRRRLPVWSWHNAALRGYAISAVLLAAAGALGGWAGALYFTGFGLVGKALLEIVNYMEHYGMVRDPADPVQPRHSWNTTRRMSSWSMFYLSRHSHHHAEGEVPYQDLRPYADAPEMIGGYLTTIIVALIPPLWHRLMTPKVIEWDAKYASPKERRMAQEANARSGMRAFERQLTA